jgi:coxsackievirus/adenovirus receptor
MRTPPEPSTLKPRSVRHTSVQLALAAALTFALAGASAASADDNVCEPDSDCVRACVVDAWAMARECFRDGRLYPRECFDRAIHFKLACVIGECGPMPGCEERCMIHGKRLLHRCIQDGGDLEQCRAEAKMSTKACIEAECRDCACPDVYDPVCGVDGMTYGNACEAGCARVQVVHRGICEPKCEPLRCLVFCPLGGNIGPDGCPTCECNPPTSCESNDDCGDGEACRPICSPLPLPCPDGEPLCLDCSGVCVPRLEPCACSDIYNPVCGVDGKTYSNACQADCLEVELAHQGECRNSCRTNADCDDRQICYPPTHTCQLGCRIDCFRYDPVCGEDGVTYGCGETDAYCHGVEVSHEGECRLECEPEDASCSPAP